MVEFRSQLEKLMPAEELRFKATPGFGGYKRFLTHAIAHPAKMNTTLLAFLIRTFTQPGEVILDPMCGSGSMGVVAALLDRKAVQVDIEKKFVDWAEEAKRKVIAESILWTEESIRNICGDARKLSEMLNEADVVLTSPPYAESVNAPNDPKRRVERMRKAGYDPKTIVGGKARCGEINWKYGEEKENIGNLPLGEVDVVITSPPYHPSSETGKGLTKKGKKVMEKSQNRRYTDKSMANALPYSEDPQNIGNLPRGKIDAVITSPPYADTKTFQDIEFMKSIAQDQSEKIRRGEGKGHYRTAEAEKRSLDKMQTGNIESKNNIGNLGKETYLEAMMKVYLEMFKVLKPNGLAIIVIKPFIRNKQVVDLPLHTWLLLDRVGFRLVRLLKLRLERESFWRVIYHQKYNAPKIAHEYVLVCQKLNPTTQ